MANWELLNFNKFNKITRWRFNYNKATTRSNLNFEIILNYQINRSTT